MYSLLGGLKHEELVTPTSELLVGLFGSDWPPLAARLAVTLSREHSAGAPAGPLGDVSPTAPADSSVERGGSTFGHRRANSVTQRCFCTRCSVTSPGSTVKPHFGEGREYFISYCFFVRFSSKKQRT